jgi:hypothetical protein
MDKELRDLIKELIEDANTYINTYPDGTIVDDKEYSELVNEYEEKLKTIINRDRPKARHVNMFTVDLENYLRKIKANGFVGKPLDVQEPIPEEFKKEL